MHVGTFCCIHQHEVGFHAGSQTSGALGALRFSPNRHPLPLFNGLKVRMGVATGLLPMGTTIKNSQVMDMCKGGALLVQIINVLGVSIHDAVAVCICITLP